MQVELKERLGRSNDSWVLTHDKKFLIGVVTDRNKEAGGKKRSRNDSHDREGKKEEGGGVGKSKTTPHTLLVQAETGKHAAAHKLPHISCWA